MIAVEPFSLALSSTLGTATARIDRRDGFLVTIDGEGQRGVGEATPLLGWTESLATCKKVLWAVADGERDASSLDPTETPAASHAVDVAQADLTARERGIPLAAFLAEDPAGSVPVNATIGDGDVTETVRAAQDAIGEGYSCLKVKVGSRSVEADLERVRAVSDAAGDVDLRVDANGAWSHSQAETAIEALADRVSVVEQPLPADDLAGHADLRDRGVEIAVDESLRAKGLDAIIAVEAADVVILKPMVLGGVRPARDLACRAREAGVAPIVTTTIDGVVARTAALHLSASLGIERACGLATADRLAEDLALDPAPVTDGRMTVPDVSGTGVRIAGQ